MTDDIPVILINLYIFNKHGIISSIKKITKYSLYKLCGVIVLHIVTFSEALISMSLKTMVRVFLNKFLIKTYKLRSKEKRHNFELSASLAFHNKVTQRSALFNVSVFDLCHQCEVPLLSLVIAASPEVLFSGRYEHSVQTRVVGKEA